MNLFDVATAHPAERIQQAHALLGDYLLILRRPSPLREIVAAVVNDLDAAQRYRLEHFAAEDAAIAAREAELAHAEDVVDALETVRVLAGYAGRRWALSFPETRRRLAPVVHLDIVTAAAIGDRAALAASLERRYGPEASA